MLYYGIWNEIIWYYSILPDGSGQTNRAAWNAHCAGDVIVVVFSPNGSWIYYIAYMLNSLYTFFSIAYITNPWAIAK